MQIVFKETVGALDTASKNERSEMNGTVTDIVVHFPPGCSSLVDVRVFLGTRQILPRLGYVALDDATPSFVIGQDIRQGDNVRVEWVNTDDTYEHTVSIIVNINPDKS